MMVEIRHLARLEELQAVELVCTKHGCGGVLRVDLRIGSLADNQYCPRCQSLWWMPDRVSHVYRILVTLADHRNGTTKGDLPGPTTESLNLTQQPQVVFVFPG